MKRLSVALLVTVLAVATSVRAKDPDPKSKPMHLESPISAGQISPTPEMWFYQQYQQQYKDPQAMVRHHAEVRATEREHRLMSMEWYGVSNQRPRASSDPYNTDYGPTWASSSQFYPNRWSVPQSVVVVVPRDTQLR
jgi:hypothetical protein